MIVTKMESLFEFKDDKVTINLSQIKDKYCPKCGSEIDKFHEYKYKGKNPRPEKVKPNFESKEYEEYLLKAKERFGELSIPICRECFGEHKHGYQLCYECGVPVEFDNDNGFFNNYLGMVILSKTTCCREHDY